jgi:uncharacterized protein (TIGR03435 family)
MKPLKFLPIAVLPALLSVARGQGQPARPQFEVASLKPNPGCENTFRGGNISPSPGRLEMPCSTLAGLIQSAYGTFADGVTIDPQPLHMEGGPSWMRSERFTVSARSDGPVRAETLAGPMLQVLLEERFGLKTHREMREIPIYAMTVAKRGLKVKRQPDNSCTPMDLSHLPPPPKPGESVPNLCGIMMIENSPKGDRTIDVRSSTMKQFAQRLSQTSDRTVLDQTNVPGIFHFRFEFTPDTPAAGRGGDAGNGANDPTADPGPSIFAALELQLVLKLTPAKGPVSFLIVDYAERPSAN